MAVGALVGAVAREAPLRALPALRDARNHDLKYEDCGFTLIDHPTDELDWLNEEVIHFSEAKLLP